MAAKTPLIVLVSPEKLAWSRAARYKMGTIKNVDQVPKSYRSEIVVEVTVELDIDDVDVLSLSLYSPATHTHHPIAERTRTGTMHARTSSPGDALSCDVDVGKLVTNSLITHHRVL